MISAPKNHFALAHDASSHLLLAGGIGVTPLLCMAERLAHAGADFEMHYCTRSPARTAFRQRIAASPFAARVAFHFDDGEAAQKLDIPALLGTPRAGEHVYVCGPKGFMDAVLGAARAAGWPETQLHYEFFSADVAPVAGDAALLDQAKRYLFDLLGEYKLFHARFARAIEIFDRKDQPSAKLAYARTLEFFAKHLA